MNILKNGDFSDGFSGWTFHAPKGSAFEVEDGGARLTVAAQGDNIQLYQAGLSLLPGTRYKLGFWAAANEWSNMGVYVHRHVSPFNSYGLSDYIVELEEERRAFEVFFTTPDEGAMDDGRLRFWLAPYAKPGSVYGIGGVSLEVAAEPEPEPEPEPERPKRIIHVIARRLGAGESLEVRFVEPGRIVALEDGGIDWEATPWRLVSTYVHD